MRRRRLLLITAVVVALLGSVARYTHLRWAPALADWLDAGEPIRKVDIVLALPGDPEHRPFVAAALVNVGVADRLVIVSTEPTADVVDEVAEAPHLLTQRIYAARGIPRQQVMILDGESASTADDVVRLAHHLEKFPEATAAIVTNAYHTRRTRWTLHRMFPELAGRISVFAAPNPHHLNRTWWRSPDGMQTVGSEYMKLAFYAVRYAPRWLLFVSAAAILLAAAWLLRRRTSAAHFITSPAERRA